MDTSSEAEIGMTEMAEAHNLLPLLHCCLFSAQALWFGNGVAVLPFQGCQEILSYIRKIILVCYKSVSLSCRMNICL